LPAEFVLASEKGVIGGVALYDEVAASFADALYQLATGTGTAITLTLPTLVNLYTKTFIASANNSGSATTINGKPLYKPNTVIAPNLTIGKAYTVWYNLASDCFFLKASAEGNALIADVLAGKTFSNDDDTGLVGTMAEMGSPTFIPSGVNQNLSVGHYSGGVVEAISLIPGEILIFSNDDRIVADSETFIITKETQRLVSSGTFRIKFDLANSASTLTSYAQLYINNVPVGTSRTVTGRIYVTFSEDFYLKENDLIQVYAHSTSYGKAYVKSFRFYSAFSFGSFLTIT